MPKMDLKIQKLTLTDFWVGHHKVPKMTKMLKFLDCQKFILEIIKKFIQKRNIATFTENFQYQYLFWKLLKNKIKNVEKIQKSTPKSKNPLESLSIQNATEYPSRMFLKVKNPFFCKTFKNSPKNTFLNFY